VLRPGVIPLAMRVFVQEFCMTQPAVGPPGTNKTQLRRQQRRHTQQCYKLMQSKLLALVTSLPAAAILASDLEIFRSNLFKPHATELAKERIEDWQLKQSPTPQLSSPASVCKWFGIWVPMPMPKQVLSSSNVLERPDTVLRNTEVLNDWILETVPVTTATSLDPETVADLHVKSISVDSNLDTVPYSMVEIDAVVDELELSAPFSCNNVSAEESTSCSKQPA